VGKVLALGRDDVGADGASVTITRILHCVEHCPHDVAPQAVDSRAKPLAERNQRSPMNCMSRRVDFTRTYEQLAAVEHAMNHSPLPEIRHRAAEELLEWLKKPPGDDTVLLFYIPA